MHPYSHFYLFIAAEMIYSFRKVCHILQSSTQTQPTTKGVALQIAFSTDFVGAFAELRDNATILQSESGAKTIYKRCHQLAQFLCKFPRIVSL